MDAQVKYALRYLPDPWDEKRRATGLEVWCLMEVVVPELGPETWKPIAVFNLNPECERFAAHCYLQGQTTVELPQDFISLFSVPKKGAPGKER
jgi:hypothetical protein